AMISSSVIASVSMSGPLSQVRWIGVTGGLAHQFGQHGAIALEHGLLTDVTPFRHQPAAADHDIADRILVAGEHGGVEQNVAGLADQRRLLAVDDDEISAI